MIAMSLAIVFSSTTFPCHPVVDGDRITARHLALADSRYARLPADTFAGFSPGPGSRRVMRIDELLRLTKASGADFVPEAEICLEWAMKTPEESPMAAAMRKSIPFPDARIQILESGKHLAPVGEIVFPLDALGGADLAGSPQGAIWHGHVLYGDNRRFNIWARVRISVQFERVVASRTLKRGELIEAASLRMQRMEGFSLRRDFAKTFDEVVGWVPIVAIREGTTILKTQIEPPKEVEKGQILQVEAQQGKVYLKLEGLAETSGRTGELVLVRNPQNGRTFRARVQAPGKVTVK